MRVSGGVGVVILLTLAFIAGTRFSGARYGATPDEVLELRQTVRLYAQQFRHMRDQVSIAQHDQAMVLAATEQLRQQNKDLLDSISGLEQQVALYKRILNPQQNARGLNIEQFVLHATPQPYHFAFRILLTQTQADGGEVSGKMEVTVQGLEHGHSSSSVMHSGDDSFHMQYFQSLIGEWVLPAGFQPQVVTIKIVSQGSRPQHVEKQFKWELTPA